MPGEQHMAIAIEAVPAVTASSLLNFHVRRNTGAPALVSATYSAKKKTWRWQVRAAPAFAGTERAHPKEALAAFWSTHEAKLQAEMKEVIEERFAALAPFSLDAFVPKAGTRGHEAHAISGAQSKSSETKLEARAAAAAAPGTRRPRDSTQAKSTWGPFLATWKVLKVLLAPCPCLGPTARKRSIHPSTRVGESRISTTKKAFFANFYVWLCLGPECAKLARFSAVAAPILHFWGG